LVKLRGRGFAATVVAVIALAAVAGAVVGSGVSGVQAQSAGPSGVWVVTADQNSVTFISGAGASASEPLELTESLDLGTVLKISDPVDGLQVVVGTKKLAVLDVVGGGIVRVVPLPDGVELDALAAGVFAVATASGVWLVDGEGRLWRLGLTTGGWDESPVPLGGAVRGVVLSPAQRGIAPSWVVHVEGQPAVVVPLQPVQATPTAPGAERPNDGVVALSGCRGAVVSVGADAAGALLSTDEGLFRVRADGRCTQLSEVGGLRLSLHAGGGGAWFGVDADGRVVRATPARAKRVGVPDVSGDVDPLAPVVSAERVWVAAGDRVFEFSFDLELLNQDSTEEPVERLLLWAGGVIADSAAWAEVFSPGSDGAPVSKDLDADAGGDQGPPEVGDGGDITEGNSGAVDWSRFDGQVGDCVDEPSQPVARDDERSVPAGRTVVPVLANDTDANCEGVWVNSLGLPSDPRVLVENNRSAVTVQVPPGVTGVVSFDYTVTDGSCVGPECTSTATVRLRTGEAEGNRAPEPQPDVVTVAQGASSAPQDVLGNDTDPDRDELEVVSAQAPEGLTADVDRDGQVVVSVGVATPPASYRVIYGVSDGQETVEGVLLVSVLSAQDNNAPVARPVTVFVAPGQDRTIPVAELAYDPDGDAVTVVGVDEPARHDAATVTVTGRDEPYAVQYTVRDAAGAEGSSTIRIQPENRSVVPPSGPGGGGGAGDGPSTPTTTSTTTTSTTTTTTTTTSTTTTTTSTTIPLPRTWRASSVSVGQLFSCAITETGAVKCWGMGLGGGVFSSPTPVDVAGLGSGVRQISVGGLYACAITNAGAVRCWGAGLVPGAPYDSPTPADVPGLGSGVRQVSVGTQHACAITDAGAAKCWGDNVYGQLGEGSPSQLGPNPEAAVLSSEVPVDVVGLGSGVEQVAVSENRSCALVSGGTVQCWGQDEFDARVLMSSRAPGVMVGLDPGVQQVAVSPWHTCVITALGGVRCWGRNEAGQLGDGAFTGTTFGYFNVFGSTTPVDAAGLGSGISGISLGSQYSCAVRTSDRGTRCWGAIPNGTSSPAPVEVPGLETGIASVSSSRYSFCALSVSGQISCLHSVLGGSSTPLPVPLDQSL
jgi:hypothetical protein